MFARIKVLREAVIVKANTDHGGSVEVLGDHLKFEGLQVAKINRISIENERFPIRHARTVTRAVHLGKVGARNMHIRCRKLP